MKHLKVNDKAPHFESKDQHGKVFNSESLKGKNYVLYFYPKDMTPGCTVQACNLRDNYALLKEKEIDIIGVSMDSEMSHIKFIEKHELPFTLLSDTDRSVVEAFGVYGQKKFMGKIYEGIHRTSFLVNKEGEIIGIIESPNTKAHSEEILPFF